MSFIRKLLDFLYPPKCAFCRKLIPAGADGICPECKKSLPFTKSGDQVHGNFFTVCVAPLYYEDEVRDALLRYKFHQQASYCTAFGGLIADCVSERLTEPIDLVSWVPLSRKRLRKRGYDQAKLLAEEVAKQLDLPCRPVLKKVVNTAPQSRTGSAEKRKANISGAYIVPENQNLEDLTILLIDDIVTTGSTLSECSRMLGMAGVKRVYCAAAAQKHRE